MVAYDIADPKRLRRVCRILEGFGTRVQFSVFLCPISTTMMLQLWDILLYNIKADVDRLSAYPLDGRAAASALHAGDFPQPTGAEPFIVIA